MTSKSVSTGMRRDAARAMGAAMLGFVLVLGSGPVAADPPPWAPAYGWRAKHGYAQPRAWRGGLPFDLGLGTCNRDLIGALVGGAAGGAVGSTIGQGNGNTAAIIGGAVLGAIVGGVVGRSMDDADQACSGQVLEHVRDGQTVRWNAPHPGEVYEVTPLQTYQAGDGRYCREYVSTAMIGQNVQEVYGTACRQPDGSWQLVS